MTIRRHPGRWFDRSQRGSDLVKASTTNTEVETPTPPIGTTIIYNGHAYRFHGLTPVSVHPAMALLQDLRTGSWLEIPAAEIQPRTATAPDR